MTLRRTLKPATFLAVPLVILSYGALVAALPYGSGDYGACTYNTCDITLTTNSTVDLPITPTTDGVNTTVNDTAEVATGASTGYTLTFSVADTDTSLSGSTDSIDASSGTQASPVTLGLNTWGYRVDGLSGFGAGPTATQTNDPDSVYAFAGVPASNQTAHTLKSTSSAADPPDATDIWYGVRIDATKTAGSYTGQVVYTAVTNE